MELEFVTLEVNPPVARVTLNRPKQLNALSSAVYRDLLTALTAVEEDDAVRVVILTGAGEKAFAAGADIAQMVNDDAIAGRRFSLLAHQVATKLENMRQVTIAAVNGYALGGGCELTLACDIRIVADTARFGLPEVGLGIFPGAGGTQRLPAIIGMGRAKELIFTGDQIDAQEAYRLGLANHVVPRAELMDYCQALAEKISSKASYAISLAKSAINTSACTDRQTGVQREAELLGLAFATHDKKEGMEAFLARRSPEFQDF
jgi:enoyl-CoA hydratase